MNVMIDCFYDYYSSLHGGANITTSSLRKKIIGPVIQRDTVATHPVCIDFPAQSAVQYPEWQQQEMTAYHVNAMVMGASGGLMSMNRFWYYRKTSDISRTLVGNKNVDNSDVVGASPVGAAPTTSSFST